MTTAAALVSSARVLLLDFDGPVCAVFAGHPACTVAEELRGILTTRGIDLPESIRTEDDPLEIIRYSATVGGGELPRSVDDALITAERAALTKATPTPYARETIIAAHQAGRRVAIVSNNSATAITGYLAAHQLTDYIRPVIGRAYGDPGRMKPDPAPVLEAITAVDAKPDECVLIGDSPTDITAAHSAGVPAIGYANKPHKVTSLRDADAIVTTMADLASALRPTGS